VLPERIGLSTSPLPRECSTTELRQRRVLSGANRRNWRSLATARRLLQLPWRMIEKQSAIDTAKRAADRRKRQTEALRANLKRRKEAGEPIKPESPEDKPQDLPDLD
jgi:hypothetical protein